MGKIGKVKIYSLFLLYLVIFKSITNLKRNIMTKKEWMMRLSGESQKAVFNVMAQKRLMRSKDLVAKLGFPSSTINKCLLSLIAKGMVGKVERGLYELSAEVTK